MSEDKEVLKEVWDGKLPVCFRLASDECNINEPDEIYLMIPRQTYFPLVTDKVQRYFSDFVNPGSKNNEIWLDFNGIPLKWHYPVGVLFDLYANDGHGSLSNLPWCLNVHFDNFPDTELLRCPNKDTVEAHFITTIKEADTLKHRGKIINEMQKTDNKQLWYGLQNDKFDQFWLINRRLMEPYDQTEYFKNIPFRIYQADKHFIQKLFQPHSENGEKRTFKDFLNFVYASNYYEDRLILVQGVTPSLETPMQWMSEHLSYPDNFLHIIVK